MASLSFNAEDFVEEQRFEPIPEDLYKAVIIDSEMRKTNAGTGSYLMLKFEVLEGAHAGRWVKTNLNLDNPNSKAVEIAQKELSSICRALGKKSIQDSEELHHKALMIKVVIQPGRGEYGPSNQIKAYSPADQLQAVATPAAAPSAVPAAAGKKPWE